ncbi:hypothetical protein OIU77_027163 [Salix suchowensis]|uniref:CDC20/Fizzy WD40 domain-containing protein n=1 Tax=Salix suchowensis TaxID=1278906 RepID=A0ABQ9BQF6_9ROSI|nr:hypothetical protein OIU77_027163 [Salix suchowensis]
MSTVWLILIIIFPPRDLFTPIGLFPVDPARISLFSTSLCRRSLQPRVVRRGTEGRRIIPVRMRRCSGMHFLVLRLRIRKTGGQGLLDGIFSGTKRRLGNQCTRLFLSGFDGLSGPGVSNVAIKAPRKVSRSPYKVLDAPALHDDFYLNLVDWSSHNVLAVGLGTCVYLWNACSSKVTKLCDLGNDDGVCSVGWAHRGTHLAVGTTNGKVQIWDASCCKRIRAMEGHRLRVGALAWSSSMLSSGSRDKSILQRDIRAQEDFVSKLSGHKSEVCGLKWSYDNRELASGGNDNRLFVWNQHSTQPVLKYCEHTAAVKAIAWSPHLHGLLASGGGTADRCIRFWNTTTNSHLSCMDTGSQVCNLVWSKNVNELVSTHGYSQNQIIVWRYPTMSKLATLTGHTFRVLYLAISPDGQTIVTGAGDETLRFWNVFPSPKSQNTESEIGASSLGRTTIR